MSHLSTPASRTSGSRRSTLVAITAAIIGIIYGYDLGNISGALLFIPTEFHLSTFQVVFAPFLEPTSRHTVDLFFCDSKGDGKCKQ